MIFYYYVNIRLRGKYMDGEHKRKRLRIKATNTVNAIDRALKACRDAGAMPISISVDFINAVPVNKRYHNKGVREEDINGES